MQRIYRRTPQTRLLQQEECYYFETSEKLYDDPRIRFLLSEPGVEFSEVPMLKGAIEIGPRLEIETPASSERVQICRTIGIDVSRVEMSLRTQVPAHAREAFVAASMDPLIEAVYEKPLESFATDKQKEPMRFIPILERGEDAMREANEKYGLGMDAWDITHWSAVFRKLGFDPSDAAILFLGNANSEHSRHWLWQGRHEIDGLEYGESLMEIAKAPWKKNPGISLVAFRDNAGAIRGCESDVFMPENSSKPSRFMLKRLIVHPSGTAETHNHPTMFEPFRGAATGNRGRERDNFSIGRGAYVTAGTAGYGVGLLLMPGYEIPGEQEVLRSPRYATPLRVLIQGSDGISRASNEIGEPLINGFSRSFGMMVDGNWIEYVKPVLYSGGLGRILDMHVKKRAPEKGMRVVQIGGPMYPIGVGGGSASSLGGGDSTLELDLKSVQRANPEMQNRANRAIRAAVEMLEENPIESIHDQGAGGPGNVLTELSEPAGAQLDIAKITLGDATMSNAETWVAEAQERYGLLVKPEGLNALNAICERERTNIENIGEISGDGRITVRDSRDGSVPIDLPLKDFLSELPRKRFVSKKVARHLPKLEVPHELTLRDATRNVLKQLAVGSKGWKLRKSDQSVTGLVAMRPCIGPRYLPLANAGVTADGYFGVSGAATAIGENPNRLLIDPRAGARMIIAEMLLNLACVKVSALEDVTCRVNWMWPAKHDGQAALIFEAADAMREMMITLGIRQDGGKDSSSLSAKVGSELVLSPGSIVVKGYAPVPDVRRKVTPDLKGNGMIGFFDFGRPHRRLGGSAFSQSLGQLGNECPDIEAKTLASAFNAIQSMLAEGLITAYHDRSDGGLMTLLIEMCVAGNRGARIDLLDGEGTLAQLFNEEAGVAFEFADNDLRRVSSIIGDAGIGWYSTKLGHSGASSDRTLKITAEGVTIFEENLTTLREWWESTSDAIEKMQANPETVRQEVESYAHETLPQCKLTYIPMPAIAMRGERQPKVAIIREEGSNGDREMAAAFFHAKCEPHDIAMSDFLTGRIDSLEEFEGIAFVGGFSFADTFGSGKGWAASILFEPRVKDVFDRFYDRADTFSFGICNGCQLMPLLGWLPKKGIPEASQPRLLHNTSGRFESRYPAVKVLKSPSIFLEGMEGSIINVHVAHGEGRFFFPDRSVEEHVWQHSLAPLVFVGTEGEPTERYPYNPNGSPGGMAALCSEDGRHLAMMPHPERCFLSWQLPHVPEEIRNMLGRYSPWLQLFSNARNWCLNR